MKARKRKNAHTRIIKRVNTKAKHNPKFLGFVCEVERQRMLRLLGVMSDAVMARENGVYVWTRVLPGKIERIDVDLKVSP